MFFKSMKSTWQICEAPLQSFIQERKLQAKTRLILTNQSLFRERSINCLSLFLDWDKSHLYPTRMNIRTDCYFILPESCKLCDKTRSKSHKVPTSSPRRQKQATRFVNFRFYKRNNFEKKEKKNDCMYVHGCNEISHGFNIYLRRKYRKYKNG